MCAAIPPKPNLVKSTALAKTQATLVRLQALLPTTVTELSPVTVYTPVADVSGLLFAPTDLLPDISGFYGVWTAPDLNNGQPYSVQVECFGPGGGGGGGNATQGGGGGAGGEYSCEPSLTVSPNVNYTYVVGVSGIGGCNNSSAELAQQGTTGSATVFDLAGITIPGGVVANPGQPGDIGATGIGGKGGTGSANSVHFDGGAGGTNQSGVASDNPEGLAETPGFFVGNTLDTSIVPAWYVLNDGPDHTFEFNDSTGNGRTATVQIFSGGVQILQSGAPPQVPAFTAPASPPTLPNATQAGDCSQFKIGSNNSASGRIQGPSFGFGGTKATVSAWIQPDPSGTWGRNAANAIATIAANAENYGVGNFTGYGLYLKNFGSAANPSWSVVWNVGNGTTFTAISHALNPVSLIGSWTQVVATFTSGTMTLYINGASVATGTAGFSSIPGGGYGSAVGLSPAATANWYFGYMSNVWWANDCATSACVTQAFGVTSPTGGAGGGASGGPGGAGGVGASASAGLGGAGGASASIPASLVDIRSVGSDGMDGWAASAGSPGSPQPAAGGGGGGDMPGSPASTTIVLPFSSAATYCGPDATGGNAGAPFNANQQSTTGALFTGGLPSDTLSGSKNTLMLMPAGIKSLVGSGAWTVQQISITFTNANPTNPVDTILEFAYTNDTSLPQLLDGSSAIEYVGNALIPAGAGTVTYDLTNSDLASAILGGTATALMFGPSANANFDAYNASTGAQFYCEVYGVGATDVFGNSLQPFLTVVLQKTLTVQVGGGGGVGAIAITQIDDEGQPVAMVQSFAGVDDEGNEYAQGFTGNISTWVPGVFDPSVVETWHSMSLPSGTTGSLRYTSLAEVGLVVIDVNLTITSALAAGTTYASSTTLPSAYCPTVLTGGLREFPLSVNGAYTAVSNGSPRMQVTSSGGVSILAPGFSSVGSSPRVQGFITYTVN